MAVTTAPRGARTPASAVSVAGKTLADFPRIAAQLHPDLNGGLTADQIAAGSHEKYWWICDKGPDHLWEATADKRTRGRNGCPFCAGNRVSVTNSLAALYPEIAAQLHSDLSSGTTAGQVTAGSAKKLWWVCDRAADHVWQVAVSKRTAGAGCPCCAGRQVSVTNSLATLHPDIAAQLHPDLNGGITAEQIIAGSNTKYSWRCDEGVDHVWEAAVGKRTNKGNGCPCCVGQKLSVTNSLATRFPEIAAQLDPGLNGGITADQIISGSERRIWWRCGQVTDHVWETTPACRIRGTGCPRCFVTGRSKFELQIAWLIREHTALHVDLDVRVKIAGQARRERVDLGIPELGFLIDLDPPYWHQDAERDQRKLHVLAVGDDRTYIRVRGHGTPQIRGNVVDAAYCPEAFVDALRPFLETFVPWRELDAAEVTKALAAADAEWSELLAGTNEQIA